MNRTLVIAISILLAFCASIYFWTEWQKKEFDASLPKPPAVEEQQVADDTVDDVAGDTAGGHWHGDEWHAEPHANEAPPVLINPDVNLNEFLTDSEIKELEQTLKREGLHPEKLSQQQLEHLSAFGINLKMLPLKQRQQFEAQIDRDYYAQFGLEPPPEGYRYSFFWPT